MASFDCPGRMEYEFFADEETRHFALETLAPDAEFTRGSAGAFFSSDASEFGDSGVLIWSAIQLEGPEDHRTGMLLLDLNLEGAELAGQGDRLFPNGMARASYHEKHGDQILFEGEAVFGNLWLRDVFLIDQEDSALDVEFALIFADASQTYPGSRVLIGTLATRISPYARRWEYRHFAPGTEVREVHTGCDGEVYLEEHDSSGCDGDTYQDDTYQDDSGCEGDAYDDSDSGCGGGDDYYDDSSSCEGDTYDSGGSDCEGDSGGYDSSSSCEGDSGGFDDSGGCESDSSDSAACDDAYAATMRPRRRSRGGPLRAVLRFLPEIVGIFFITRLRRRFRPSA